MTDEEKRLRDGSYDSRNGIRNAEGKKPEYAGSYDRELRETYDAISSRPAFRYDPDKDGLYQRYKDDYTRRGRLAMRDTVGQASALTGGYGSSYAESAGQQQYDAYLQQLGDIVPELYSLAYSRYQDEGDALRGRYDMLSELRDREYREYSDALDSYNEERKFGAGKIRRFFRLCRALRRRDSKTDEKLLDRFKSCGGLRHGAYKCRAVLYPDRRRGFKERGGERRLIAVVLPEYRARRERRKGGAAGAEEQGLQHRRGRSMGA